MIGQTLAAFHGEGVHHADLNAHNILLDSVSGAPAGAVPTAYLLDFDRGCIRRRGPWENDVLARLRRSLEKIKGQRPDVRFADVEWEWLMEGYREADSG